MLAVLRVLAVKANKDTASYIREVLRQHIMTNRIYNCGNRIYDSFIHIVKEYILRPAVEREALIPSMEVEPGFPCLRCGADTEVFFSSKTGKRRGWSCPQCKARGFFRHRGARDQAIMIEA